MLHSIFRGILVCFSTLLVAGSVLAQADQNPYVSYRVETYKIQAKYLESLAAHQTALMVDMQQKMQQQQWQTTAIAILVIVMVLAGIVLAAWQFYADYKSGGKSSIHLKLGSGSFEFKSSVIGIAILILSMWFFQSYIDRVYDVQITTIQPVDVTTYGVNQ